MNLYIFSCPEDHDMNTQKILSVIAIVTLVAITAFGSFAVVTTPVPSSGEYDFWRHDRRQYD